MPQIRILNVEDEAIMALELRNNLEHSGYTVLPTAKSALDALQIVEKEIPDVVIMDIHIKGNLDGTELAKIFTNKMNIPVIFLTGYADEVTLQRAKECFPAGFFTKPIDFRALHAMIEIISFRRSGLALRQRETWYSDVITSIADAVIATDEHGYVKFINLAAETLTGWYASEVIGRPLPQAFDIMRDNSKYELNPSRSSHHHCNYDWYMSIFDEEFLKNTKEWIYSHLTDFGWVQDGILITKEHQEVAIEFTVNEIRNDCKEYVGAVFVLRDQNRVCFQSDEVHTFLAHKRKKIENRRNKGKVTHMWEVTNY
jgi:two-component system, response regulator PdtaR